MKWDAGKKVSFILSREINPMLCLQRWVRLDRYER
jgi:hypothetical protein